MASSLKTTNVATFIDERPLGRFQWLIIFTGMAASILDGYDLASIGLALPFMGLPKGPQLFGLTAGTWINTAVPVGMLIGALILGPLADRVGRRKLTVLSIFLFGFFTLLVPHAPSWQYIALFRFLVGIGSGGILPNLVPLISEYAPKRRRAAIVTVTFSAIPFGSMIGALIGGSLIARFGTAHWRYIFDIGGSISLLVFLWCLIFLPESLRFLAVRGGMDQKILSILRRANPTEDIPADTQFSAHDAGGKHEKASLGRLFGPGRTDATLLITVAIALNTFTLYLMLGWLTKLLTELNLSDQAAVYGNVLPNLGGVIGAILLGQFMDRFNRFYVMGIGALVSSAGALAIAFGYHETWILAPALFFAGSCVMGGQPGLYALLADIYPTSIRGTGSGFGLGAGRTGSIIGPLVGGILLVVVSQASSIFVIIAVPSFLVAVSMWFLNRAPRDFADPA